MTLFFSFIFIYIILILIENIEAWKRTNLPLVSFKFKFFMWWFLGLPNPDHRQGIASQFWVFFMLLMSRNFTCCAMQTFSGFPQRKPLPPLLTQDRYGSGVPLGGSDVQQGMALNQNAFLPLLLGNPDFLKLYMENPLLASQYVTILMRGNVCQMYLLKYVFPIALCCPPKIHIVQFTLFLSIQIPIKCMYFLFIIKYHN